MRSGLSTNSNGSAGARLGVVAAPLVWLVLWAMPAAVQAQAQTDQVAIELAWNWPVAETDASELGAPWLAPVVATFEWWLSVGLDEPPLRLPSMGRVSAVIDAQARWSPRLAPSPRADGPGGLVHPRAPLHRATLPRPDGERLVLAELMLDLNAVRLADPQRAGWGSVARALAYWKLSNARDLMLHVRASPRPAPLPMILEVDLTWSSRSEPMHVVHTRRLTTDLGAVESATLTPPGSAWTAALPLDVRLVIARCVGSAMAGRDPDEAFDRSAVQWAVAVRDRVTRLSAVLGERSLVSGGADGISARLPLARESGGRSVAADMKALQARLGGAASADDLSGSVAVSPEFALRWSVAQDNAGSWLTLELRARGADQAE